MDWGSSLLLWILIVGRIKAFVGEVDFCEKVGAEADNDAHSITAIRSVKRSRTKFESESKE